MAPTTAHGRSCNGCTMCCKLLSIEALDKPALVWCKHCDVGVGCKVYGTRPEECQKYYCGYLLSEQFGEHWKPVKSKMVVSYQKHANRVNIHVDPGKPHAWKEEPFYSEIKRMAVEAAKNRYQVLVWQGLSIIAILPDREKNLGILADDQFVINSERILSSGTEYDAFVVHKDDPQLRELQLQERSS